MKKGIKYILGIVLMIGMSSCGSDWLDLNPTTSVATSDALSTVSDLQIALNGAYRQLGSHYLFGDYAVYGPELKGEYMQCAQASSSGYTFYTFTQSSGDENTLSTWYYGYQLIHYVNNILGAIDNSGNFDATDSDVKEIRSESLALRALTTFVLTNMYGQAYTISPSSLGVCLLSEDEGIDYMPARSTVSDCYTQIVSDFKEALDGLSTSKSNGYINKWAAEGLLSRVYLYMGDYQDALTYAKDVINNSPYELCSNDNYAAMWGQDFPAESLFEIYYSSTETVGYEYFGTRYCGTNYKNITVTDKYLDLLNEDPNDVRHCFTQELDNTVYSVEGTDTTYISAWLTKYPGKSSSGASVTNPTVPQYCDCYVLRLSELYLTAAECDFRLNGTSGSALTYLNAIVNRANPNKTLTASDLSVDRIFEERVRELVGEGVSAVYDLLRTRGASGTINHTGGRHLTMTNSSVACNSNMIPSPIPTNEISNNPNIEQNPGYSN